VEIHATQRSTIPEPPPEIAGVEVESIRLEASDGQQLGAWRSEEELHFAAPWNRQLAPSDSAVFT